MGNVSATVPFEGSSFADIVLDIDQGPCPSSEFLFVQHAPIVVNYY